MIADMTQSCSPGKRQLCSLCFRLKGLKMGGAWSRDKGIMTNTSVTTEDHGPDLYLSLLLKLRRRYN